jgi:uncharacterized membrane protein
MTWTDQDVDTRMGRLLQVGVIAAAVIMALGGLVYLFIDREPLPDYKHFHVTTESLRSIPGIFRHALEGHSTALIQVGGLIMIGTPVARVAFAAYAFAKVRDHLYVAISSIVLGLLLYGLLFGN